MNTDKLLAITGWLAALFVLVAFSILFYVNYQQGGVAQTNNSHNIVQPINQNKTNTQVKQNTQNESANNRAYYQIMRCGALQSFEGEPWFDDFYQKISNEYVMSTIRASYFLDQLPEAKERLAHKMYPRNPERYVQESYGKISKEYIKELCLIKDLRKGKDIVVALVGEGYCALGNIFRYDLSSKNLKRVFYPQTHRCSDSLQSFKKEVIDLYMLPVISAFGDAGVYHETWYLYDLLHNTLSVYEKEGAR